MSTTTFQNGDQTVASVISNIQCDDQIVILDENPSEEGNPSISPLKLEGFSQTQIERFHYLTMYYGEDISMSIVQQLKTHGLNSWTMVCDKISKLTDIEANEQEYHDMIDEKVSIGTKYTNADTIKVVSTVRRSLGMKPYLKDILKQCIKDFLFRHMADVELSVVTEDSNDKPTAIAYIPTINLNDQLNESR